MNKNSKLLSLVLFLSTFFYLPLTANYEVVEDQMAEKVRTPSLQNVQKMKIRLDNGLEALLISDPNTHKSGASLSVGVGQIHEPFHQVGLAHFVEHMLFMGTEKYPVEKEYHEFIEQNGGRSNAYTACNQTVFMYEINNDKMQEAFSRFSAFFSTPLFNSSGLSRERQAVDQEFSFRANMDGVRQFLVMLEMVDEKSPLHNWRCGNKDTLSSVSRDELVEWYQSNYGANKMKLAVYSSLPLNEMAKLVDQNLSSVPQNKQEPVEIQTPVIQPENLGSMVYIEPIKDLKQLTIQWEVPQEFALDLDHHTMDLVSVALSEEYPRSLASFLKREGYIQRLSAGGELLEDQVGLFAIQMDLTEKGLAHREKVIGHCFEAINGLKAEGIPRYRFDEMTKMSKLNYQYQSRPNIFSFLSEASSQMHHEALETYPQKHEWPTKFSRERNLEFLNTLNADNAIYFVMASNQFVNKDLNETEKLSGVKFAREPISEKQLQAWNKAKANSLIGMAPPNPYIPSDLNLVNSSQENYEQPELVQDNERSMVYYYPDQQYQVPEAFYSLYMNTPNLDLSPKSQVLSDLYTLSISDDLSAISDQGRIAGLHYGLQIDPNFGLNLTVKGYSQKSFLFVREIIEKLKVHTVSKNYFERYREKLVSLYENQKKQIPIVQANQMIHSILLKDFVPYEERVEVLQNLSLEEFEEFCSTLYDQVYIRGMLYGNIDESQAVAITDYLNDSFGHAAIYPLEEQKRRAVLELSDANIPHFVVSETPMEGNAALLLIGQGSTEHQKMAALQVFSKAMGTPFFDTLRTKQQTGYYVKSYAQEIENQLFTFYMVLSNSHATRDLLARFELFNEDFLKVLNTDEFSHEKFDAIRNAIITELQQPPRNLLENGQLLTNFAFEKQDFSFREKQIEALQNLTFEEFLEFSSTYFGRANPRRIAVLIDGNISPENALNYIPVQNVTNFKAQLLYTTNEVKKIEEEVLTDE